MYDVPTVRPIRFGTGLGIEEVVGPHRARVLALARNAGVEAMWVFGSVRRGEATPTSDVDLLVRWRRPVSLLDVADLRWRLEKELGRRVDIVERGGLHWAMTYQIEAEAVAL